MQTQIVVAPYVLLIPLRVSIKMCIVPTGLSYAQKVWFSFVKVV